MNKHDPEFRFFFCSDPHSPQAVLQKPLLWTGLGNDHARIESDGEEIRYPNGPQRCDRAAAGIEDSAG
jgi:hypothetical protein